MTTLEQLEKWQAKCFALDAAFASLQCVTAAAPESPLADAIFTMLDAYTGTLARHIGDKGEWLDWWRYEASHGERPFEAKAASWSVARKIETLADLAALIAADVF